MSLRPNGGSQVSDDRETDKERVHYAEREGCWLSACRFG